MYAKKCDEVAQENVGINSLKVLTVISHDSSDQLPVVVQCAQDRCHTACYSYVPYEADSRNADHLSLSVKAFFAHVTLINLLSLNGKCLLAIIFPKVFFLA